MSSGIWRKRPVANQVASQPQREPRAALSVLVEVHVDKVLAVPECGAPGVPLVSLRLLVFLVVAALERRLRILAEGLEAFLAVSVQGHLPGRDRNSFTGTHLSLCSGVRAGKLSSAVAQLRMVVRRWPSQKANVPRLLGGANSQGTWCNCVSTCSSSTFPLFPKRLPRRVRMVSSSWSMTAKTTAWLRIRTSVVSVGSVSG
uniref:Uncharacterized protein n=1 Tax=Rhipicephalus zambeziensis TaxID=60191 RepID=A0A224Y9C6_9ACAR